MTSEQTEDKRRMATQRPPSLTTPVASHREALATLEDGPYVAYCAVAACKLFISLVVKRWPALR